MSLSQSSSTGSWLAGAIIIASIGIDQALKAGLVGDAAALPNPYGPFSISLPGGVWVGVSTGILLMLAWYMVYKTTGTPRAGLALIVGGGISNVIDRLFRGHVVDFIEIHNAAFNTADVSIAIGVLLIGTALLQAR